MTTFVTRKIPVINIPLDYCVGQLEPSYTERYEEIVDEHSFISRYSGDKQKVVKHLINGFNCYQISKKMNMNKDKIYKIRDELKEEYRDIVELMRKKKGTAEDMLKLISIVKKCLSCHKLAEFARTQINCYDPEAVNKKWNLVPLQDTYFDIWENNPKSCTKAPREHLKTTSVVQYLIKKIFERKYPLEINYFHLNADIAKEKLRKLQQAIERNPIFREDFKIDEARSWKDGELRLADGTQVQSNGFLSGAVGKHPHIIVLDDVIDQEVIYSDVKNDKAIRKFYSDIYPMITNAGEDKKIIIIGTAQREDDLYEKLPTDFANKTFDIILNEENQEVLEPALFTWEQVMKVKKDMSEMYGERFFDKEYRNRPFSAMGMIIDPSWIKYYDEINENELQIYQGWDLGVGKDVDKGDWTAGATVGIKKIEDKINIYILEIYRARIPFGQRLNAIVDMASKYNPLAIGVENNVFQYDTVQTLQKQTNLPIHGIKTVTNKVQKFRSELAPHFENGKVYIKRDMIDLRKELLSLPVGVNDDMCDSITLAISTSSQFGGEVLFSFI